MTSPAYRVCVDALERLLSPRVVARTLRMAMEPYGLTPETVGADDLERILKGPIFRQLQVAMAPDRAREKVEEILASLPRPPASDAGDASDPDAADAREASSDGSVQAADERAAESADVAAREREQVAQADEAPSAEPEPADAAAAPPEPTHPELARLREALRPYNLYFEWPEVRRVRAQLARIDEELAGGGEVDALLEEADGTLADVRQKLEDRLVLQAQELAGLEEALSEVEALGGPKVRRLASLVKRIRDAQEHRQLADAEIERGSALARDLRKLMASSVYQEGEGDGGPDLDERLKALDVAGELEELERLLREEATLLEHRVDLAARLAETRDQVASGLTLGEELPALREELAAAERERIAEVRDELAASAARLDALPGAWNDDLSHEHQVLQGMLDDGLPPLADLVRYRDLVALAVGRAEREDRQAEADAASARARLDAQGEHLARARQELLRYGDDDGGPAVERLRDAVEALRLAQAEERLDPDADAELRAASENLAVARRDEGDPESAARAQVQVLLSRLDGLPSTLDPYGAAELKEDLEPWLDEPPDDTALAAASAAVAEAVAAAREQARVRLERVGGDATRWSLAEILDAVRDANERLEDARDPDLAGLERRLEAAREEALRGQLDRLHRLERDAERLVGIDEREEASLTEALARARASLAEGVPPATLDAAAEMIRRLASTLDERVHGVMPRLDAALATFVGVERLNSDDVATVRRILRHLDSQREAFDRVSPSLRARMERSLQEAEDLLDSLVEEEKATREIADQLMSGNRFDDVLGLFGDPKEGSAEEGGDGHESGDENGDDGSTGGGGGAHPTG